MNGGREMQIASFILVHDKLFRQLEDQMEAALKDSPSPNLVFMHLLPVRLQEMGREHPISIPFGSLYPLDQAAGRQRSLPLTAFEDPLHPSRLGKLAEAVNLPIYYVSPGRVRNFVHELETLRLAQQVKPEDVETLLGKKLTSEELPDAVKIIDAFRHDLYQIYRDAAMEGKGVVVLVVNQPSELNAPESFPRAA